jgi:hypothetical protein
MRAEAAEADRRLEVREAALAWQRAGVIDAGRREAVESAFPDDRVRLGPVFRILVFGFTVVAVTAALGLLALLLPRAERGWAGLFVVFGLGLAALTEVQLGPLRRAQGGTESATAFLAVLYLFGGLLWLIAETARPGFRGTVTLALALAVVLLAAAAWRWGYLLFAAGVTACLFLLVARTPIGRALWVAVPVVAAPLLLSAGGRIGLAPAHRRCCQASAAVALSFLYLGVHLGSWDAGLVEEIGGRRAASSGAPRALYVLATALVPVLVVAWGVAARRRLLIDLGLAGILASLVTLRFYVHVAPLWIALSAGGAAAIVLALAARRYLDSGPRGERHGLTAQPLFDHPERRSALEVAAGMAAFSPAARPVERPGFEPGGGRFGGGGASGSY